MQRREGVYTENGFAKGARLGCREAFFTFDLEICEEINRQRKSCPPLEKALVRLPVWLSDEEPLPLDMVEESIWFMLGHCHSEFRKGNFKWIDAGAVWRDIEQFAAMDLATGTRMVDRFNKMIDIWLEKPAHA